jgi:hypothetical protein
VVRTTWELIGTEVKRSVERTVHCFDTGIPSAIGRFGYEALSGLIPATSAEDLEKEALLRALEGFRDGIVCMAEAEWGLWAIEAPIEGIPALPVGIKVCLSAECLAKIRSALADGSLAAFTAALSLLPLALPEALDVIATAPWLAAPIGAVAAALGITVVQAAAALVAILLLVAYQGAAILGQLAILDALGETSKGACLAHPSLLLLAIGAATAPTGFGPFAVAAVGLHTPVVVLGRT